MRGLFILICTAFLLIASNELVAQTEKLGDEEISQIKQHQMYLEKPAISIEYIEYEKDQQRIKGELSGDGMRIIMDGYTKKGRVKAIVNYADGTTDEFIRSSCYIDPVIPL